MYHNITAVVLQSLGERDSPVVVSLSWVERRERAVGRDSSAIHYVRFEAATNNQGKID